ncbi:MAG: alpha/beta fold hydrolase [Polyangiales bacterium]
MPHPRHNVPNTDLTYDVQGSGRDVVLAHGLGGLFHSWSSLMPLLTRTHRVWEVGFPDFDSVTTHERHGNSIADYVADLRCFTDHVGLERAVVIGNSLGGQVAAHFASASPSRVPALVLLASSGLGERRGGYSLFPGGAVRRLLRTVEDDVVRAILRTVFANDASFEQELPQIRERLSNRKWKLGLLTTARRVRDACVLPLLPAIDCPTLMVYGELDRIVPIEYARAAALLLPRGELEVLSDTGHAPQIERPLETHRHVLSFLQRAGWG